MGAHHTGPIPVGCWSYWDHPSWVPTMMGPSQLGDSLTGTLPVGCPSHWAHPSWVPAHHDGTLPVGCPSYWDPPSWVPAILGPSQLGTHHTGPIPVGCWSYWDPPSWVPAMVGPSQLGTHHTGPIPVWPAHHDGTLPVGRPPSRLPPSSPAGAPSAPSLRSSLGAPWLTAAPHSCVPMPPPLRDPKEEPEELSDGSSTG